MLWAYQLGYRQYTDGVLVVSEKDVPGANSTNPTQQFVFLPTWVNWGMAGLVHPSNLFLPQLRFVSQNTSKCLWAMGLEAAPEQLKVCQLSP